MSTLETITAKLEEYFEFPITETTTFASLEMDSLDQIEVQILIEAAFDIMVQEDKWLAVKNITEAVALVDSILN